MMPRRAGFTLVELLVVLAIIGALAAILLPAVQAAREAARRAQCAQHLKQIGLAIQTYAALHRYLPPGNILRIAGSCPGGRPGVTSEDAANWLISILPYIEQKALYEAYDFKAINEGLPNKRVREAFVATYACPSEPGTDRLGIPADGPACAELLGVPYMPGSYRAVSGRSEGRRYLDSGEISNYPRQWRGAIHSVGVLGFGAESFADIRDGTSSTLLVGESTTRTSLGQRTFWAYSYSYYSLSAATPQARTLLGDYDHCNQIAGTGGEKPCKRGWGSFHSGGMNFVLCDGSVRFLKTSIDMNLLAALATIDGGEVAQMPD